MFILTFLIITEQWLTGSTYVLTDRSYYRAWQPYTIPPQLRRFSIGYQPQFYPVLQNFNPYQQQSSRFASIPHPQLYYNNLHNDDLLHSPTSYFMQQEQENYQDVIYQRQSALFNILKCLVEGKSKEMCRAMINNVKEFYESAQKPTIQVITITPSQVATAIEVKLKPQAEVSSTGAKILSEEDITVSNRNSFATEHNKSLDFLGNRETTTEAAKVLIEPEHIQKPFENKSKIINNLSEVHEKTDSLDYVETTTTDIKDNSATTLNTTNTSVDSLHNVDMAPSIKILGKLEDTEAKDEIALFENTDGGEGEALDSLDNMESATEAIADVPSRNDAAQNVTLTTMDSSETDTSNGTYEIKPTAYNLNQSEINEESVISQTIHNEESVSNTENDSLDALNNTETVTDDFEKLTLAAMKNQETDTSNGTSEIKSIAENLDPPEHKEHSKNESEMNDVVNVTSQTINNEQSVSNTENESLETPNTTETVTEAFQNSAVTETLKPT